MTLQELLDEKGWRQIDLASRSRSSAETVRKSLRGIMPSALSIFAFATALGVSEEEVRQAIQRSAACFRN